MSSAGTTSDSVVSGGLETVLSSGAADATTVLAGGKLDVSGTATGTVVSNGGVEIVESGATATGAIVRTGGFENVFGSVGGTTVSSGGSQYVYAGSASGTTLSGGFEHVASGAAVQAVTVNGGSFEIVSGGADDSGAITFSGPGLVKIDAGTPFASISGFQYGDSVDFAAIAPASTTVTPNGGNTVIDGVTFAGSFVTAGPGALTVSPDAGSGTLISIACFAAGTRIATDRGEVPVERLAVGDRVWAAFAGTAPVIWIGRRRLDCRRHSRGAEVWPVRVRAHAFGFRRPYRDLWLSPDHAVFVDRVLIPIRTLIDGVNVVQEAVDVITYFHVELPRHDAIRANGLPAESYPGYRQPLWTSKAAARR